MWTFFYVSPANSRCVWLMPLVEGEGGVRLCPYNGALRDLVILALPHGARKGAILAEVARRCGGAPMVSWDSSGGAAWPAFVAAILDAMRAAGDSRVVLIKMVPDREKVQRNPIEAASA